MTHHTLQRLQVFTTRNEYVILNCVLFSCKTVPNFLSFSWKRSSLLFYWRNLSFLFRTSQLYGLCPVFRLHIPIGKARVLRCRWWSSLRINMDDPPFRCELQWCSEGIGWVLLTSLALVVTLAEAFETINWIQMAQFKLATQAYRGPSSYHFTNHFHNIFIYFMVFFLFFLGLNGKSIALMKVFSIHLLSWTFSHSELLSSRPGFGFLPMSSLRAFRLSQSSENHCPHFHCSIRIKESIWRQKNHEGSA